MKPSLGVIDRLFDYLTPEVLNNSFEQKKLSLKLKLLAKLYPELGVSVEFILEHLNLLISDTDNLAVEKKETQLIDVSENQIDLTVYYSTQEIDNINKAFGFKPNNRYITYNQIYLGYLQNSHIPKIKDYYYQLLWAHFKSNDIYDNPGYNSVTNTLDEMIYAREKQS